MSAALELDVAGPATGTRRSPSLPRVLPPVLPPAGSTDRSLDRHVEGYGPMPFRGGADLLRHSVERAGITGRGGAAFPSARKLLAVRAAATSGRGRPVVIANGAEGEPASAKDKTLLWASPHLVLDGLQLAGEAVGADTAYLYVHREPHLVGVLMAALEERRRAGVDRLDVRLVEAPSRFLAGEESAVVNRVGGGDAVPLYTPQRVSERGVAGRPTLVQNVETLAQLALVARYGATWFRAVGTADEPGSMLTTVHPYAGPARVAEVAIGTPLAQVVPLAGAGAVLVGGYHGAWLPTDVAARARLANADLRPYGAALGAGVLAALPRDRCGVAETARVVRYLAAESAGQCGPCLNGLPRIAAALGDLAAGRAPTGVRDLLARWSGLVERRGACSHPDGTVRLVRSTLTVFADEVAHHLRGRCTAGEHAAFLPIPPEVETREWR